MYPDGKLPCFRILPSEVRSIRELPFICIVLAGACERQIDETVCPACMTDKKVFSSCSSRSFCENLRKREEAHFYFLGGSFRFLDISSIDFFIFLFCDFFFDSWSIVSRTENMDLVANRGEIPCLIHHAEPYFMISASEFPGSWIT